MSVFGVVVCVSLTGTPRSSVGDVKMERTLVLYYIELRAKTRGWWVFWEYGGGFFSLFTGPSTPNPFVSWKGLDPPWKCLRVLPGLRVFPVKNLSPVHPVHVGLPLLLRVGVPVQLRIESVEFVPD